MNKQTVYIVAAQNKSILSYLLQSFNEFSSRPLMINKDESIMGLKEDVFTKYYGHIPRNLINVSNEYLHIFKEIESNHVTNMLKNICEHNKGFNIVVYGTFFKEMSDLDWIEKTKSMLQLMGWKLSLVFLTSQDDTKNNHRKNSRVNLIYRKKVNQKILSMKKNSEITKICNENDITNYMFKQRGYRGRLPVLNTKVINGAH